MNPPTKLFTSVFVMAVAALGGMNSPEAQTVQRVTTSSKEYGSSLKAGVRGTGVGSIQVGGTIPYATMNGERPRAAVRRYRSGPPAGGALQPQLGGLNPLLQAGMLPGSGYTPGPRVFPGPTGFGQPAPRPQAVNPYTGQSYGTGSQSTPNRQSASRDTTIPGHYAFPGTRGVTPRTR